MNKKLDSLREQLNALDAALQAHIAEVMLLYTFYNRITEAELLQVIKTILPIKKALIDAYWCGNSLEGDLAPDIE